jgi:hypothetical protein
MKTLLSVNCYQGPVSHNQCKLCSDSLKVDKSFVLGQISDDYGFLNYKLYTTLRANLSLLNAELYQLELMVMISFIFFSVSWLLNKGFYEYYFEVFDNDARNGFKKDACVL